MTHITIEKEKLGRVLEALEYVHSEKCDYMVRNNLGDPLREDAARLAIPAITFLRQAIAEAEKQEPVAHLKLMMEHSAWEGRLELSDVLANIDEFYTHPQPKREPLTLGKVAELRQKHGITSDGRGIKEFTQVIDFVRDMEAAHGIKE